MTTDEPLRPHDFAPLTPEGWRAAMRGWDAAFYLAVAIVGTAFVAAGPVPERPQALGGLALLTVAYATIGRRAARTQDLTLSMIYVALLVGTTYVVVHAAPFGSLFLFAAYAQVWYFCRSRALGIALTGLVSVVLVLAVLGRVGTAPDIVREVVLQVAVGMTFSLLLGLWIYQVVTQSQERAALIARLERARADLAAAHRAEGVSAERERLAREIHDTLAQGFTSIIMLAQTARAEVDRAAAAAPRDPSLGRAGDRLTLIEQTARDNLAEARALVAAFSPGPLRPGDLAGALRRTASRFTEETGVPVRLELPPVGPDLEREVEVVLLRAAQEGLANVRKHARARSVRLALTVPDGSVELVVEDDGVGITPETAEGFGLRGMRDRVHAGGGQVWIERAGGRGTRVVVRLPRAVQAERAAAEGVGS